MNAPSTSKHPRLVKATPSERYHTLSPSDKIAILWFMVNVATSSKAVHAHIESSEEQLTTLRKEKIELGRSKKAL
jgi:bromodomain adjacent to zinc finger domain protein 1A